VAVQRDQRLTARATTKLEALHTEPADSETARKRIVIEAALARARERAAARASSAGQAVAASEQRSNRVERES
jgi:hypothetical protein